MIPIYRAKKIDSDEWVDGYLLPNNKIVIEFEPEYNVYWSSIDFSGNLTIRSRNHINIDQKTLTISFDDGKTFDDINEVKKAIDYVKGQAEIWSKG